jgi:dTDP-4-amino-4,6-dideoxygalactose transaminase
VREVPFFDLGPRVDPLREELHAALDRVLRARQLVLGPEVHALESEIASLCGTKHAVGVSSGTDALLAALLALGVGPGDEVITTALTFVATGQAIARTGARPVFVDVDARTLQIDPARVEAALGPRTKAILPVHLFGRMADVRSLRALAERAGAFLVEDAAQAIGAHDGELRAGAVGDAGCLSFFPTKNLGALGDGGMVLTNDGELAARVRRLRAHGQVEKNRSLELGGNFRLDELQAAFLRVMLPHLAAWTKRRVANARRYLELFRESGLAVSDGLLSETAVVALPAVREGEVAHQFVVRVRNRDAVRAWLSERRIGTEVYYPVPLHLQPCFDGLGGRTGDLPEAERAAGEVLALPIHPGLEDEDLRAVVAATVGALR